jgi:hypothetical protein
VLVAHKEQVATGMLGAIQFLVPLQLMVVDTVQMSLQMAVLAVLVVGAVEIVPHELVARQLAAREMLEVRVMTAALGRQEAVAVQVLLD